MGYLDLNLDENILYLRRIKKALTRRGLRPDLDDEWEIHGPHQNMNYQVLIGGSYDKTEHYFLVAIYPWAVYEIEAESEWWKVGPENRMYILKK